MKIEQFILLGGAIALGLSSTGCVVHHGHITRLPRPHPPIVVRHPPRVIVQPPPRIVVQPTPTIVVRPSPTVVVRPPPRVVVQPPPTVIVQPPPRVVVHPPPRIHPPEKSRGDNDKGNGKRHDDDDDGGAGKGVEHRGRGHRERSDTVTVVFSPGEREIIHGYVKNRGNGEKHHGKKSKALPPGLAKKVARGGELPPGWQKKCVRGEIMPPDVYQHCQPLPAEVVVKLPPPPAGTIVVTIDNRIVRLAQATREILDVFDVL